MAIQSLSDVRRSSTNAGAFDAGAGGSTAAGVAGSVQYSDGSGGFVDAAPAGTNVALASGPVVANTSNGFNVEIQSSAGGSVDGRGGYVFIKAGDSPTTTGGALTIQAGSSNGDVNTAGGSINIMAGTCANGMGGDILFTTGFGMAGQGRVLIDGVRVLTEGQGSGATLHGTATLDFGAFPGNNEASVIVSIPGISVNDFTSASFIRSGYTPDHDEEDHCYLGLYVFLSTIIVIGNGGFEIHAVGTEKLEGRFKVAWFWSASSL